MKKAIGAKTIVFPTPVFLVGSYDGERRPNIMTASWGGICCSDPPCVAVSLQKTRHSYANIVRSQAFTISIPSVALMKQADFAGTCSGRDVDKFAATGLTPVGSTLVNAPYVEQCPLVLECEVVHMHDLGVHVQFVGRVLDVKADISVLDENGLPDLDKVAPFSFSPANLGYYGMGGFLAKAFSLGGE